VKEYSYTIILHPEAEEGGYSVTVPALPGCATQGETIDEAVSMAKEAIALHIEGLIAHGLPVPEESEHALALVVKVAA
jgi:predicted RNase H-like HicB family nuclease